jgi:hypothetical protein
MPVPVVVPREVAPVVLLIRSLVDAESVAAVTASW